MIQPIQTIVIYSNASAIGGTITPIKTNADGSAYEFPVTDSCERNATLRGDDFVKLSFNLEERIVIPAFAFIWYDSQIFFCKEEYRPKPKGGYYEYEVKFVSFANMLSKPIAFRHVEVDDEQFDEPTIDVNGTLKDIATVICTSIQTAADRYTGILAQLMRMVQTVDAEISISTEMKTFTYEGQRIAKVLEEIVSTYEDDGIDYWFEISGTPFTSMSVTLHFSKCERTDKDLLEVSDTIEQTGKPLQPIRSRGLLDCDYSQEWTGVPQRIIPFGSDRNIKRNQAIVNNMFVSYGKRLRLHYEHQCTINNVVYSHAYAVKNSKGEYIPLYVDARGSVSVPGITTGEEIVDKYEDIYPRCHYRVDYVSQRGTDNPIYRVYGTPMNADGTEMTQQQIESAGIFPITIEDGATLSMLFESGYLNGREFEVANHSAKMAWIDGKLTPAADGQWYAVLEIVPEGDNNESAQIPFGNFVPRAKDTTEGGYEGDTFAIFNMVMPDGYISMAEDELAQRAYDKIQESVATRPEVKCTGEPNFFQSHDMFIGKRVSVLSEKFGDGINADILDHPNLLGAFCIDYTNMAAYSKNDASFVSNTSGNTSDGFAVVQGYKTRQGGGYDWVSNLASRNSVGKLEQSFVYDGSYDRICVKINGSVEDAYILFNPSMEVGETYTVQLQFDSKSTDGHGNGGTISHIKLEKSAEVSMWTIAPSDADGCFVSRVTSFSHSLTKPSSVTFKMSSARIQGQISAIKAEIADRTSDIQGVEQTAKNLSRRGFYDAVEMKSMLDTLAAEMMVVGVEKNQFSFTMGISIVNERWVSSVNHFSHLHITAGILQHTQEPYIKDACGGRYSVDAVETLNTDINGVSINSDTQITYGSKSYIPRLEPYYVYAELDRANGTADIVLVSRTEEEVRKEDGDPYGENEDYLLLGTLSSEFEDGSTSFRIFNRTNGYTQIAGGTITTEQIQDPTRSLVIDMSSNPPRIVAKNGAEIIGNIRFLSADGTIKTVDEVVDESVGKIEIGGENIYTGDRDIRIPFNGTQHQYGKVSLGVIVTGGNNYVVSANSVVCSQYGPISVLIKKPSDGSYVTIGTLNRSDAKEQTTFYIEEGGELDGGELYLTASYGGSSTAVAYGLMVQIGNKATTYHEYLKYLAAAFEDAARHGSTDIDGGLIMTSLLKLRNEYGIVTAGMSGLSGTQQNPENVLLWGGANYQEALYASLDPNYKKEPSQQSEPIITLIKKDGTGKIGCFEIEKDTVYINGLNGEKIIITEKSIEDVVNLQNALYVEGRHLQPSGSGIVVTESYNFEEILGYKVLSKSEAAVTKGKYRLNYGQVGINLYCEAQGDDNYPREYASSGYGLDNVYLLVVNNGNILHNLYVGEVGASEDAQSEGSNIEKRNTSITIGHSGTIDLDVNEGSLQVFLVSNSAYLSIYYSDHTFSRSYLDFTCYFSLIGIEKYSVFAKDGIGIVIDANNQFFIYNDSTSLKIIAEGLPVGDANVETNQLYVNRKFEDGSIKNYIMVK